MCSKLVPVSMIGNRQVKIKFGFGRRPEVLRRLASALRPLLQSAASPCRGLASLFSSPAMPLFGGGGSKKNVKDGALSLPEAVKKRKPDATVLPLITPAAAALKDEDGKIPLHIAALKKASPVVIKALLAAYPEGAETTASDGFLPVNKALTFSAPEESIKLLLDAYPESMSIKDKNGFYPLHTHLLNATEGVTLVLLDGYPDACKAKDSKHGYLPLHLAAKSAAPVEVVKAVLTTYPEAVSAKENAGNLALHLAIANNAPAAVVKLLLAHDPDSIEATGQQDATPMSLCDPDPSDPIKKILEDAMTDAGKAKIREDVFGKLDVDGARAKVAGLEAQKADLEAKVKEMVSKIEAAKAELAQLEKEAGVAPAPWALLVS